MRDCVYNRFGRSSKCETMKCGVMEGVKCNNVRCFGYIEGMEENALTNIYIYIYIWGASRQKGDKRHILIFPVFHMNRCARLSSLVPRWRLAPLGISNKTRSTIVEVTFSTLKCRKESRGRFWYRTKRGKLHVTRVLTTLEQQPIKTRLQPCPHPAARSHWLAAL